MLIFLYNSELRKKLSHENAGSAEHRKPSPDNVTKPTGSRNKLRSLKQADKSKVAYAHLFFSYRSQ